MESTVPAPAGVPAATTSNRASSRKNRVHVFREFLLKTFPAITCAKSRGSTPVLDVAGGQGDLSWLLLNVDQIQSIVVDPRTPKHCHLHRCISYLREQPHVLAERAIPHLPTHHPMARLMMTHPLHPPYHPPQHLRLLVNQDLVSALRTYLHSRDLLQWSTFWEKALETARKALPLGFPEAIEMGSSATFVDPREGLEALLAATLVVGFHPDQATGACMDLALLLGISYCVVPCCVFPSEFQDRLTPQGTRVRCYDELLAFLKTKDPLHVKVAELGFEGTSTARNIVLYRV